MRGGGQLLASGVLVTSLFHVGAAKAALTPRQCRQLYGLISLSSGRDDAYPKLEKDCARYVTVPVPPPKKPGGLPAIIHVDPPRGVGISQHVFARSDNLDNPAPGFLVTPGAGQALGLSFGYTQNNFVQNGLTVSASRSVTATGLLDYVPLDHALELTPREGLQLVPSFEVSANGNYDHPTKATGDTSALKLGPNFTFQQSLPAGNDLYGSVLPFYQTDFYGHARAAGATFALVPAVSELSLAQTGGIVIPHTATFFELRPDLTYLAVEAQGQTLLQKRDYVWLGGEARAYMFLLPKEDDPLRDYMPVDLVPYVEDRISLIATYKGYVDASSGKTARFLSATAQYKLSCSTGAASASADAQTQGCPTGATSVGVEYDYGFDRDTLQKTDKIVAKLSFAY